MGGLCLGMVAKILFDCLALAKGETGESRMMLEWDNREFSAQKTLMHSNSVLCNSLNLKLHLVGIYDTNVNSAESLCKM